MDVTGFSKAGPVDSSTVRWSGSVDPINFAKSLKLSQALKCFPNES